MLLKLKSFLSQKHFLKTNEIMFIRFFFLIEAETILKFQGRIILNIKFNKK